MDAILKLIVWTFKTIVMLLILVGALVLALPVGVYHTFRFLYKALEWGERLVSGEKQPEPTPEPESK